MSKEKKTQKAINLMEKRGFIFEKEGMLGDLVELSFQSQPVQNKEQEIILPSYTCTVYPGTKQFSFYGEGIGTQPYESFESDAAFNEVKDRFEANVQKEYTKKNDLAADEFEKAVQALDVDEGLKQ